MKVGVISDVHANKVALNSVLEDMPTVQNIICCGDIIGYGPSPREAVDIVSKNCDVVIRGNHESMVLYGKMPNSTTARAGISHAKEELFSEHYDFIASLNKSYSNSVMGVYHSHPEDDKTMHVYEDELADKFSPFANKDFLLYGHTHVPVNRSIDGTLVVNPGSVGQPRDGDNRSSYAVIDTDSKEATIHRVSYDIDKVVEKLKSNGFPEDSERRLRQAC